MLSFILNPFTYLPLRVLHGLGFCLGTLLFYCMPQAKKRTITNIKQSQLAKPPLEVKEIARKSFVELGKAIFETPMIWQKKEADILPLVKQVHGWEVVKDALQLGKGIIFLTPHLGCFEITSIYYGNRHPITVLYRPPKLKWLERLILNGRKRTGVTLAEANASGVRKLMQALKRNEAIGILPDQIPAAGEGEWADFFGKPAYTMTLASKLAEKTGATVLMAFGERLVNGAGYDIHITRLESITTTTLLNNAIEQQIALNPTQYLWRYDRYKQRRHAMEKRETPATTAELKSKPTKQTNE
ncbi:lysophospholipid acyltransferase family protein [Methylotenera versatilis]|uniref:lysophospholipid acyltransferase family protein n=1 Tax=Methylotenera versatilis TaxID=1055487 RepID=UPI00064743ED|nr:lysophospholipid acyltransferase family protein [Methylotenera versatilis]